MFDTLIADTQRFVRALSANNSRDWFQANKSDYDKKLRDPAKALLEEMSPRLAELAGFPVTSKLFRPHRDVRFSKDKTPYNTHLHMMWTIQSVSFNKEIHGFDFFSYLYNIGMQLAKPLLHFQILHESRIY